MFTCHKQLYEKGELLTDFSRIYYFISPTTDRIETENRHMGHVKKARFSIVPIR